jgi:uncharacterized protein YciI
VDEGGAESMSDAPTFIYVVRPKRAGMIENPTPDEESRLAEHFDYLESALREGRLILAGPCLDGGFGIVIFEADTREAAQRFLENDPAVRSGLMKAELHSFRISLMGRT